jgi:hypothetical protein
MCTLVRNIAGFIRDDSPEFVAPKEIKKPKTMAPELVEPTPIPGQLEEFISDLIRRSSRAWSSKGTGFFAVE